MKTFGKMLVVVLALIASVGAFAAEDEKINSETFRDAARGSDLCRGDGRHFMGISPLGKLYFMATDYVAIRATILRQSENLAVHYDRQEAFIESLSNWSLEPRKIIWNARPLITEAKVEDQLKPFTNWGGVDWDRFFIAFVKDYKKKIGYPDVGCFSYSEQEIQAP